MFCYILGYYSPKSITGHRYTILHVLVLCIVRYIQPPLTSRLHPNKQTSPIIAERPTSCGCFYLFFSFSPSKTSHGPKNPNNRNQSINPYQSCRKVWNRWQTRPEENNLRVARRFICTIQQKAVPTFYQICNEPTFAQLHIITVHKFHSTTAARLDRQLLRPSRTTRKIQPASQGERASNFINGPFVPSPVCCSASAFFFPSYHPSSLQSLHRAAILNPSSPPFGPCRPDCAGSRESHVRPWQA